MVTKINTSFNRGGNFTVLKLACIYEWTLPTEAFDSPNHLIPNASVQEEYDRRSQQDIIDGLEYQFCYKSCYLV